MAPWEEWHFDKSQEIVNYVDSNSSQGYDKDFTSDIHEQRSEGSLDRITIEIVYFGRSTGWGQN